MSTGIRVVTILAALSAVFSLTAPVSAQVATDGGSGLLTIQKARTLGHLNFGVGAFYESSNLDLSGSANGQSETDQGTAPASLTLGLGEAFEVSLSAPWSKMDLKKGSTKESGSGDGVARLKWNFLTSETHAIRLSAIASTTLPLGDKDKGLGSGKSNPGLALALDKEYGSVTWHADLGYLKRQEDNTDNQLFYGAGLEYMPIENVSLIAEISGYSWSTQVPGRDDSSKVMFGGRYYVGDWLSLTLGYGSWGGGYGASSPNYMYMGGVTVGLGLGQPKKTLVVESIKAEVEAKPEKAAETTVKSETTLATPPATTMEEKSAETQKAVISLESVHFLFDKSGLLPDAKDILKRNADKLKANPGADFVIEGHTCSIGTKGYNQKLGLRRAISAKKFLIEQGISADRIEIISYGADHPTNDNKTKAGRKMNRRADFVIKVK
jgi:outer membrane protein OmpA-like peptidoglycan-associated protein